MKRTTILEGRLRPGARLPGTRDLAGQYGLSRGTIVTAFEQLKADEIRPVRAFRPNLPALDLFPTTLTGWSSSPGRSARCSSRRSGWPIW